jgi:hypothetical protein
MELDCTLNFYPNSSPQIWRVSWTSTLINLELTEIMALIIIVLCYYQLHRGTTALKLPNNLFLNSQIGQDLDRNAIVSIRIGKNRVMSLQSGLWIN